jgi:hypothetical protein
MDFSLDNLDGDQCNLILLRALVEIPERLSQEVRTKIIRHLCLYRYWRDQMIRGLNDGCYWLDMSEDNPLRDSAKVKQAKESF